AVYKAGVKMPPAWVGPVVESIAANGEVTYDKDRVARLSTRAPGSVWRVLKKVGDPVKEGEVLAVIDAAEVGRLKGEFLQAFALVDVREKTVAALQTAYRQGVIPDATWRQAQAGLLEARIRLRTSRQSLINLGFAIVAEDFRGMTEERIAA